ncbi:hypothetical protein [Bacillus licheniformis]|uniref:hypothetical protein n=1 Tax=Bacillus licheniformis TaxID=1402 RepID=UPI0011A43E74|nr:hypothetical protein [Bacillus licheniformis]MCD2486831.1 hypothetical protein [Bacillus licheniformis]MDE1437632.1 hypothetical protein [Bacillus licheniformis]MEC1243915.1 hypothetical protein [Bacillus licheniformis]MEC1326500.1 hypothetical protein [Bacillus licheniformis]TWK72305.1 hypothetical protein CHCC20339_3499 [Bacillus licheniformis]
MFKQRLIGALAYLAALTLLLGLFSAGCLTGFVIVTALLSVPAVGTVVKVGITIAVVFMVTALLAGLADRLYIAYREHKRVQKDVEEETQ